MTASAATLAEVRERLLRSEVASRHPDVQATLDAARSQPSTAVTVVVVGEKKRGKSSLVNALLRRPGLFPVDVDIATSCYVGAQHGDELRATAYADEAPEGVDIPLGEIDQWASVEGNRIAGSTPPEPLHPGVTAVVVELPIPLLEAGLTLVDTPGVGGLEAGHTDITLAVLRQADALLFVVDPDSGLRRSELDFLAKATDRISHVAFAMTKVDRYPSWQAVLAENRARLEESAPDWAESPWFALSSLIAYDAAEAADLGEPEEADQLWEEAGFDRLEAYLLGQIAGRSESIRAANEARELRTAIGALEEAEQLALAAATGDPALRDKLNEQQAALSALLADDASWPSELRKAFEEVRTSIQKDFRTLLRNVRADLQDRLTEGAVSLPMLPSEVDAALRAVWIEVNTALHDQVRVVVAMLAGDLANEGADVLSRQYDYPDQLGKLPQLRTMGDVEKDFGDTVDEYMPVVVATGGAYTILVGVLSLVNPVTAIAIGLGAGLARRNAQQEKRVRARDRASGVAFVTRSLEQAADDLGTDLQRILVEMREQVERTVRDLMTARRTELESQVRELKQRVRADEATEAVVRRKSEGATRELAELRAMLEGSLTEEGLRP
jgi:hypothetical protein